MIARVYHKDADEDGWKTLHGEHVHFKDGEIDKGNPHLVNALKGKAGKEAKGEEKGLTKSGKSGIIEKSRPAPKFTVPSPKSFQKALSAAKATCPPEKAWRVDSTYSAEDYSECKLFSTEKGSTVAIKPDGDIISVCKCEGDALRGRDLIKYAVENGGTKLDSFSGNHKFYVHNGFEPVSWCEFDEKYAPDGWDKNRDELEPVIFYKYTGKTSQYGTLNDFLSSVPASKDYDTAKEIRNKELEKKEK
jgi:hypothetical protein